MKNFYSFIFSILLILNGINGTYGQVSSGDFQYTSTISGDLKAPSRIAVDNNDFVYVTDAYDKVIRKYNPGGSLVATLTIEGTPLSVAVNPANQLFVGDAVTGNILKVYDNGSSSVFYSGCNFPNALSFSPDGLLYVSDSKLHKVLVLNSSGTLVQTIGEGTLIYPTGISYDRKNHRIIVGEHGADNDNLQTRIYIYSPNGTLITMLGSYGNGDAKFYRVQGITAGRCGNIYICEPFQGKISVYKENGSFLTRFSQFGFNPGDLNLPMDIAFDSQDRIWIASMNNGALELYTINDPLPSASMMTSSLEVCQGQSQEIEIKLTGVAPWSLTYTIDGQNPITVNNVTSNPYHLSVSQPGIYVVTALSDAVNTGYCFSGSTVVTAIPAPTAGISSGLYSNCEGQVVEVPVNFTGDSPYTITYTHNGTNPVTINNINNNPYLLQLSETGDYEITAFNNPGCDGNILPGIAQVYIAPKPVSDFNYFTDNLSVSLVNTSVNATSYLWNFGDQQTSTLPNPVHNYTHSGTFMVTLSTWSNDCRGYNSSQMITITGTPDTAAISNNVYDKLSVGQVMDYSIEAYPNPCDGIFSLEITKPGLSSYKVEISNMTGQLVAQKTFTINKPLPLGEKVNESIDISQFPNGIYSVKVTTGEDIKTVRLVLNQ